MASKYLNLDSIDENWEATDIATLLFVLQEDEVLLIRKNVDLARVKSMARVENLKQVRHRASVL